VAFSGARATFEAAPLSRLHAALDPKPGAPLGAVAGLASADGVFLPAVADCPVRTAGTVLPSLLDSAFGHASHLRSEVFLPFSQIT